MSIPSVEAWEAMHAHYDLPTYQAALNLLKRDDVVLDIGAGDLQFSRQMALRVRKVYAIEINESVLRQGLASPDLLPANLFPICADARVFDFPTDSTVGVLLMRHCTYFRLYSDKLRAAGAGRLITNARWHMSVEEINLLAGRTPFNDIDLGWYACSCGATGFKPGAVERWLDEMNDVTHEVFDCPQCKHV